MYERGGKRSVVGGTNKIQRRRKGYIMKKNIFKRVLSFMLALTMILSLPIGRKVVSAAESTTLTDGVY